MKYLMETLQGDVDFVEKQNRRWHSTNELMQFQSYVETITYYLIMNAIVAIVSFLSMKGNSASSCCSIIQRLVL